MITPTLKTATYMSYDGKCYLTWVFDESAVSYEIYRNGTLFDTVALKDLDRPFLFLRFPRNTHLRNELLKCKLYVDETVKKFATYDYQIRAVYENNQFSERSNLKYVLCE